MEGSPKILADLGAARVALRSLASCLLLLVALVWLAILSAATAKATTATEIVQSAAVQVRHVFVVVLENEPYEVTFGKQSLAPYLAHTLPKEGILLPNYYGIGHHSLDNYIAMISGQAPNPATQDDCKTYSEFRRNSSEPGADGQMLKNRGQCALSARCVDFLGLPILAGPARRDSCASIAARKRSVPYACWRCRCSRIPSNSAGVMVCATSA